MKNSTRVDFFGQQIEKGQDVLETKGKIAFEIINNGTNTINIEGMLLKRGDHEVFTPPIPGAVFNTNKRISLSNPNANVDAVVIYWVELNDDDNGCN